MRLLEFNCGEKNLACKEELRTVQKRMPELEDQIKSSESEIEHLKKQLQTESKEKLERIEECSKLRLKLSEAELILKGLRDTHLSQNQIEMGEAR